MGGRGIGTSSTTSVTGSGRQLLPAIPAGCCVFELPHVVWTAGKASRKVGATLPRFKIGIGIV